MPAQVRSFDILQGFRCQAQKADTSTVDVCFLDPRAVLDPGSAQGPQNVCTVTIPASMLPLLPKGIHELGDADDPLNAWVWGRKAEIFQYELAGTHTTKSGFTSVIAASAIQDAQQKARGDGPAQWGAFQAALKAQDGAGQPTAGLGPLLFAGRIIESPACAVYVLRGADKSVEGLLVSSEAATQED